MGTPVSNRSVRSSANAWLRLQMLASFAAYHEAGIKEYRRRLANECLGCRNLRSYNVLYMLFQECKPGTKSIPNFDKGLCKVQLIGPVVWDHNLVADHEKGNMSKASAFIPMHCHRYSESSVLRRFLLHGVLRVCLNESVPKGLQHVTIQLLLF